MRCWRWLFGNEIPISLKPALIQASTQAGEARRVSRRRVSRPPTWRLDPFRARVSNLSTIYIYPYLYIHIFIYLSVFLSIYLSIYLYIYHYVKPALIQASTQAGGARRISRRHISGPPAFQTRTKSIRSVRTKSNPTAKSFERSNRGG